MRILAIGGAGFIGRQVIGRLVAQGHVVHVPTRQFQHGRELLVHPTVTVMQADIHDDATLERLVAGCDIVLNFVGILHSREGQPYGADFERAHVQLPRRIAQACRTHQVKRFIHISALGADLQGPSGYLRSKAAGEQAIRDSYAAPGSGDFTIFRPYVRQAGAFFVCIAHCGCARKNATSLCRGCGHSRDDRADAAGGCQQNLCPGGPARLHPRRTR